METVEATAYAAKVAAEIRAHMGRAGITQREVCAATGMSAPNLSRKLRGEASFGLSDLVSITTMLNVPLSRVLADAEASLLTEVSA